MRHSLLRGRLSNAADALAEAARTLDMQRRMLPKAVP
jgi:hypothetical protein